MENYQIAVIAAAILLLALSKRFNIDTDNFWYYAKQILKWLNKKGEDD